MGTLLTGTTSSLPSDARVPAAAIPTASEQRPAPAGDAILSPSLVEADTRHVLIELGQA